LLGDHLDDEQVCEVDNGESIKELSKEEDYQENVQRESHIAEVVESATEQRRAACVVRNDRKMACSFTYVERINDHQ